MEQNNNQSGKITVARELFPLEHVNIASPK